MIPGRDSARTLPACLGSALDLARSGEVSEILFVDDGSKDQSAEIARAMSIRVLESGGRGPGAARNLGFRHARTPLVWFVDSDCVIEPDALQKLRAVLVELGAEVVGGSYANRTPGSLTARLIHGEMMVRHRGIGRLSTFAITANLLCRHSTLERLGGFDESLQLAQDLDFAYRVCESGGTVGFAVESRVAHYHETKFIRYVWKQARQGYWRMHLYRKHPRRITGDSYSGLADYAQPPLALISAAGALGLLAGALFGVHALLLPMSALAVGGAVGVFVLELPMAFKLAARTSWGDGAAYLGFGFVRAVGRGLGMTAGFVLLARSQAVRYVKRSHSTT